MGGRWGGGGLGKKQIHTNCSNPMNCLKMDNFSIRQAKSMPNHFNFQEFFRKILTTNNSTKADPTPKSYCRIIVLRRLHQGKLRLPKSLEG